MTAALPRDEIAEKIIIGALMSRPEIMGVLDEKGIADAHFPEPNIFRIVARSIEDRGTAKFVDIFPSLTPEQRGYVSECEVEGGPLAGSVGEYCARLRESWRARELTLLARTIADRGINGDLCEILPRWQEIMDGAPASASSLPAIQDAASMIEIEVTTPPEVIEGLLHLGSKLVLGGGSKSFKTWSLLDMGVSVAAGVPWWDFETMQGRVLFCNFEIAPTFFASRIREVCRSKGVKLKPGQLDVLNLRGFAADGDMILPQITRRMAANKYALVVLDPLYKLLGSRDENASKDMAGLMNAVERLAVKTGAAVVFGSHFAKGNASGKESMDRISGSGVFARDPDSILTMTRHEEEDAFTVEMTLRNHPPQEAFVVRRSHPLMVRDGALDPAKLKQVGGRKQEVSADDVLAVLGDDSQTFSEWCKAAEEQLIISRDTFKRRLRDLTKTGKVRQSAVENGRYVRALGAEGAVGCKTHMHPSAGARCRTPLGSAPAPYPASQGEEGAE